MTDEHRLITCPRCTLMGVHVYDEYMSACALCYDLRVVPAALAVAYALLRDDPPTLEQLSTFAVEHGYNVTSINWYAVLEDGSFVRLTEDDNR